MSDIRPTTGDSSWFVQDRFGLFIHWGLYALLARHEWVRYREVIPEEVYNQYFHRFDPDLYDPNLWAEAAAGAGMKYFVITTKHHEGFCLWDSDLTDFKAPKTPAGRDLIAPMVEAFRQRQMRVGFYHSLIDWHHPHFVIDRMHPIVPPSGSRQAERDARPQALQPVSARPGARVAHPLWPSRPYVAGLQLQARYRPRWHPPDWQRPGRVG